MFKETIAFRRLAEPALRVALAGALAASLCSFAAAKASAAQDASGKDETVYVKAAADGAVEGMYVVNRFAAGSGTVADPGSYLSVTNLTTSDALEAGAGGVVVPLQADEPFYYEGQLDAATALPWDISLSYWLDGKKVEPVALGGADGLVRIELSVKARTDASEPGVSDFANAYVLQAQGTFDAGTFEIELAEGAMVAQVGGESIVSCMVLPGEDATFALEGQARGFATSGWQISALPLSLAIEIANQDTSQLTDATSQLQGAAGQLSSGSSSLAAGASSAVEGADELGEGAAALRDGSAELAQGATQLAQGMGELSAKSGDLLSGWGALYSGSRALADGAAALAEGSNTYIEALEEAESGMAFAAGLHARALSSYEAALSKYAADPTSANKDALDEAFDLVIATSQATGAQEALGQALEGYGQLAAGIEEMNVGASEFAAGAGEFDKGLDQYTSGVETASAGADDLAEGAASIANGSKKLSDGMGELEAGLSALGIGSRALAAGANQLATAVQGMDAKVLDAIQETIDNKLGADFEPHSFVASENAQVGTVQFVYVVEGISAVAADSEASVPAEEPAAELGFIDRILEFIKGIFS